MKHLSIIGSTGSIGCQTLDVADNNQDKIKIVALAAGHNIKTIHQQILKYQPQIVAMADEKTAAELKALLGDETSTKVLHGTEGLIAVATCSAADTVLTAVTGTVGLLPTIKAIEAGKDIALANKETLVAAGGLVMSKIAEKGVKLLPVDSEHSAIWQCLNGEPKETVSKLILTASGGPFRQATKSEMVNITPEMALKHPNWNMGSKITIDSATLMNKGLEVLEAHWLFNIDLTDIEVVVHPQSIIHSMVEFRDGSVMAQLGIPDMRTPIQYALSYPSRWPNKLPRLDLLSAAQLTFEAPDLERFPCLGLAYQAGKKGGTMPAVLNAANEVAVARFLNNDINFLDIPRILNAVMEKHQVMDNPDLDDILAADRWAREMAKDILVR